MTTDIANLETIRDLRKQIEGLSRDDENDIVFRDVSSAQGYRTLYRMLDGEPVRMSVELARTAINRVTSRGPWWTTDPEKAPKWVEGKIPCFLHPDAPEREVLAELGLPPVCEQGKLRNAQAKRVHAIHCHKDEWAAYQEYLSDEAIRSDNARRDQQIEATLALAGRAAGQPEPQRIKSTPVAPVHPNTELPYDANGVSAPAVEPCECGWDKGKNQASLDLHKRMHCPLRNGAA